MNDFYVVYNAANDKFLRIVLDEAEWVENLSDNCYCFATPDDARITIGTLIGRYDRNKMLNIIDQVKNCYLVPVVRRDGLYDLVYRHAVLVIDL